MGPPPHSCTHVPAEHALPGAHTLPHAPQLLCSDRRSVSQPFISMRSQSAKSRSHAAMAQPAAMHVAAPWAIGLQATPQPPQLFGSVCVGVQAVPQHVKPRAQPAVVQFGVAQTPPEHTWPAPQRTPQPPQLLASVVRAVSHPVDTLPSQSAKPGSHAAMPHTDDAQPGVPRTTGPHTTPQPPQLFRSVCSLTHTSRQHAVPGRHIPPRHGATQTKLMHVAPPMQSRVERHGTHWCVSMRHRGFMPPQSESARHPGTQRWTTPSQICPRGQLSGAVTHSTQRPVLVSHTGVAGVLAQSAFTRQPVGGASGWITWSRGTSTASETNTSGRPSSGVRPHATRTVAATKTARSEVRIGMGPLFRRQGTPGRRRPHGLGGTIHGGHPGARA